MRTYPPSRPTPDRRRALLAMAGVAGLAAGPATASVADVGTTDLETWCTGVAGPVTVPSDLVVPAGETCLLDGTVIQGDADVRRGASLITDNGAVLEGDLLVRREAYLEVIDGTVQGETQLRQAFGGYAEGSSLGAVDVRNSGFFHASDSDLEDHLSRNSETALESVRVSGGVDARGDLMSDLQDTVVTGDLTVQRAELGSLICNSEIDGTADVRTSNGVVQVGGDSPYADCGTNVFGTDLALRANSTEGGTTVSDAIIRGDLVCATNEPAPVGGGNRVRGEATGQCADLQPGDGGPRLGASTQADRHGETVATIQERSVAARQQAHAVGSANLGR